VQGRRSRIGYTPPVALRSKVVRPVMVLVTLCAVFQAGCGGGGGGGGTGSGSGAVVSCDIVQAGIHYCEEAPGSGTNTGCPTGMTGFTPGTGCSHDGVVGTCKGGPYTYYLYDATAASALASICPGGSISSGGASGAGGASAGSSGGIGAGGSGGSSSSDSKVACYIPQHGSFSSTNCTAGYYTAGDCQTQGGTAYTTCPQSTGFSGCCNFTGSQAAFYGTEVCYYDYPTSDSAICASDSGTWSLTP